MSTLEITQMEVRLSPQANKRLGLYFKTRPELYNKILNALEIFANNPLYPSLRLHKLYGGQRDNWSLTVEKDVRIIFIYRPYGILVVNIGNHKEVYH